MIRIVDLTHWWTIKPHDEEQMEMFSHLDFEPIKGHRHLFVVDVSDEEMVMLTLIGVLEAKDINTDYSSTFKLIGSTKFLHKGEQGYHIIQVNGDIISSMG